MEGTRLRVDGARRNVWRFADHYQPRVDEAHRLTLGEGGTPLVSVPALASALGVGELLLKRDDLSPGGSHKARSLAYRVSLARQRGEPALAISSSGNAAVAAGMYAGLAGLRLFAFVSPETPPAKLRWLRRENVTVVMSARPRNLARYAGRLFGIPNLTPSLDDLSIEGFKSIAGEIQEQAGRVDALFTFVTSGSSFVGMARMFDELRADALQPGLGRGPALHAVQSGAHPSVAAPSDARWQKMTLAGVVGKSKLAGLLGIEDTPRAEEARGWLGRTGGYGWVALDDEIREARDLLRRHGIDTSPEGCAGLSAVRRARQERVVGADSRVVVVLTGHATQWPSDVDEAVPGEVAAIDTYAELRRYLGGFLPEREREGGAERPPARSADGPARDAADAARDAAGAGEGSAQDA